MNLNTKLKKVDKDSRNVVLNMVNTLLVKGGALVIALLTTPEYMRYFNNKSVLGVWYTMLSILTWVLYFDLGIGNGLRNKLVESIASGNIKKQKEYVSSAYIFLSFVAAALAVILLVICRFINWNVVFNVSEVDISRQLLTSAVMIVLSGIICQFVLRLISSIMYAIQKAFIPNLMSLITNTMVLLFVFIANRTGNNNRIILLSWVYFVASILPMFVATLYVFLFPLRSIRPNIHCYQKDCAIEVFKTGSGFLILQIAGMMIGNSFVVYLISVLLGAASVVEFNVYYKIFSNAFMLFTILMTPIWSAITKAMATGRFEWIKRMLKKLRFALIAIFFAQFSVVPIMQTVFDIWLGDQTIPADLMIQLVFILNNGIMMLYQLNAQICNGLGELKRQIKWMLTANVLLIFLSFLFTRVYAHYTSIIVAQTVALIPYCAVMSRWLDKYINQNAYMKREE